MFLKNVYENTGRKPNLFEYTNIVVRLRSNDIIKPLQYGVCLRCNVINHSGVQPGTGSFEIERNVSSQRYKMTIVITLCVCKLQSVQTLRARYKKWSSFIFSLLPARVNRGKRITLYLYDNTTFLFKSYNELWNFKCLVCMLTKLINIFTKIQNQNY